MASVDVAIKYAMGWEDSTLSGVITIARDGKRTRFGIDEHFHPQLAGTLFYTCMDKFSALKIASAIFDLEYCQPLCIEYIADQEIANKLLSLGVNMGVLRAAKMLQDVLRVDGDGHIGPITLHALECDEAAVVLEGLREDAEIFYKNQVIIHPEDEVELKGWLRRAAA